MRGIGAEEVQRIIDRSVRGLRGMVEYVTEIVMDAAGNITSRGTDIEGDDGNVVEAETMWHLGFYSRPLDGSSGVVIKPDGRGGASFLLGWRNRQYEVALEKGEVAMANEAGARWKLDKDGNVRGDSKDSGSSGKKILMQGGGGKVARAGDNLTAGANLLAWASIVEAFCNGVAPGTFTPANQFAPVGSPPPGAANPGAAGSLGTINSGSNKVEVDPAGLGGGGGGG